MVCWYGEGTGVRLFPSTGGRHWFGRCAQQVRQYDNPVTCWQYIDITLRICRSAEGRHAVETNQQRGSDTVDARGVGETGQEHALGLLVCTNSATDRDTSFRAAQK